MHALRSVGYRTELFLASIDGEIEDRGEYLVVRTPSNPDFWWGNFLLYRDAPTADRIGECLSAHARELPGRSAVLIGWDAIGDRGPADAFARKGFEIDESVILTARSVKRPAKVARELAIAPLRTEADWRDAAATLTNAFAPNRSGTLEDLCEFVDRQLARYAAMQARGEGTWFGGRIDGEMAGCLGLVRVGALGRFQLVGTHPAFGRRGVCGTLVHHVGRWALEELDLETLVMAADANYHAAKVYESVGFSATEHTYAAIRKRPAM